MDWHIISFPDSYYPKRMQPNFGNPSLCLQSYHTNEGDFCEIVPQQFGELVQNLAQLGWQCSGWYWSSLQAWTKRLANFLLQGYCICVCVNNVKQQKKKMAVVQPTHLFLFCFVDRWNMRVLSKSHPLSDLLLGTLFPFSLKTYWNKLDHIAEEYIRFLSEPTTNIKTYSIKSSQSPKDNIIYCTSDGCPGEPDNNIWIYTI